ncbi:MAG: hypothetical protein JSR82_06525 [Verrucomicrobia bacterium]|nr:hypothetical protein [Verrucomicrobiota bacterium]
METYIVHVSDAGLLDARLQVKATRQTLGAQVGAAIDGMLSQLPVEPWLPLFVDIHPATGEAERTWMYEPEAERVPELALRA